MRLVCPNCGAQYEVPIDVIPHDGRDVQCSSCAHTWFQHHPDNDPGLADDLGQPMAQDLSDEVAEDLAPPPSAPVPRRAIDDGMAELFREEREFEARARESETIETQTEFGLQPPSEDEEERRVRQARERMARMRGQDTAPTPEPTPQDTPPDQQAAQEAASAAAQGSRRDLLPDVEELNQTLRSPQAPAHVPQTEEERDLMDPPRQGGFGKGFFLVVVFSGLACAAYLLHAQIAQYLPALGPALDSYVSTINDLRSQLDAQVQTLLKSLNAATN
jgi:predicted Zn finger-like uncharacterized protein